MSICTLLDIEWGKTFQPWYLDSKHSYLCTLCLIDQAYTCFVIYKTCNYLFHNPDRMEMNQNLPSTIEDTIYNRTLSLSLSLVHFSLRIPIRFLISLAFFSSTAPEFSASQRLASRILDTSSNFNNCQL